MSSPPWPSVQLPRKTLLALWSVLTPLAYYLVLFTNWGHRYQGSGPLRALAAEAAVVLAAFACLEVLRREKLVALRAVAGALGFPLVLVALLTLWYGLA
jgi:hypothetical protein